MSPFFRKRAAKAKKDTQQVESEQQVFRSAKPETVPDSSSAPSVKKGRRATGVVGRKTTSPIQNPVAELTTEQKLVKEALDAWGGFITGDNSNVPLADVECLGAAKLDLTDAHPGGLAQFMTGKPTKLSLLLREPTVNENGQRVLREVVKMAVGTPAAEERQSVLLYLATGVGFWQETKGFSPICAQANGAEENIDTNIEHSAGEFKLPIIPAEGKPRSMMPTPPGFSAGKSATNTQSELHKNTGVNDKKTITAAQTASASVPIYSDKKSRVLTDNDSDPQKSTVSIPRVFRAPILVREVRVTNPSGNDPVLMVQDEFELNPVFVQALESDGPFLQKVLTEAQDPQAVTPREVLDKAQIFGKSRIDNFQIFNQTFIAALVPPAVAASRDIEKLRPRLLKSIPVAAIAGDSEALKALSKPFSTPNFGDRDPNAELGGGDLDMREQNAIEYVHEGEQFFINAPWGSRPAHVVAGIVTDAAASGKSVLYVSGSQAVSRSITDVINAWKLEDLCLDLSVSQDPEYIAKNLRAGLRMTSPTVDDATVQGKRNELRAVRDKLIGYVSAMHDPKNQGHSPYSLLEELATLTSRRPGPRTRVRLDEVALKALEEPSGSDLRECLRKVAELGAFSKKTQQSAWLGANIQNSQQAQAALDQARLLGEELLGPIISAAGMASQRTGINPAGNFSAWEVQIELLKDVGETLKVFSPEIFSQSLNDLVAATATGKWRREAGISMGISERRRYRKLIKSLLLDNVHLNNIHEALTEVESQRNRWRRISSKNGQVRVPAELASMYKEFRYVKHVLEQLQAVIPISAERPALVNMPFAKLIDRLTNLTDDGADLRILPECVKLLEHLESKHLGELLADLTEREVSTDLVVDELDLAIATTVLTQVMRSDADICDLDTEDLQLLVERFRVLDKEQVRSLPGPVIRAVVRRLRAFQNQHKELTMSFDAILENNPLDFTEMDTEQLKLARLARPITLILLPQVATVLGHELFDLVVFDGVEEAEFSELLPAIGRAKQVVAVADLERCEDKGIIALAGVFKHYTLPVRTQQVSQVFLERLGAELPQEAILPDGPLQRKPELILVDGFGVPSTTTGCVDSPTAEVEAVVEAIISHSQNRSNESLAVVALTAVHAEAIKASLRAHFRGNRMIAKFLSSKPRGEAMVITDISSAYRLERDCVIFTVGIGKTPHGMVLHRFGPLQEPDGAKLLISVLGAARHALTVVSSLAFDEIDRSRLAAPGAFALADMLELAANVEKPRGRHLHVTNDDKGSPLLVEMEDSDPASDNKEQSNITETAEGTNSGASPSVSIYSRSENSTLYADLVRRIERVGVVVRKGIGPVSFTLAPGDFPDTPVVAVLTDNPGYALEPSLRYRDRLVIEQLEEKGWVTRRIFSIALFVDPKGVTEQLIALVDEAGARLHGKVRAHIPGIEDFTSMGVLADLSKNPDVVAGKGYGAKTKTEAHNQKTEIDEVMLGSKIVRTSENTVASGSAINASAEEGENIVGNSSNKEPGSDSDCGSLLNTPTETALTDNTKVKAKSGSANPDQQMTHPRIARPDIVSGRPLSTYGDDEIDELMLWLVSDGVARTERAWRDLLASELGIKRRDAQVEAVLGNVVRRCPILVSRSKGRKN